MAGKPGARRAEGFPAMCRRWVERAGGVFRGRDGSPGTGTADQGAMERRLSLSMTCGMAIQLL